MTTYCVLGGGGSFGMHTSRYLLEQSGTDFVLGAGRARRKPRCFTLDLCDDGYLERKRAGYAYAKYHIGKYLELLMATLDDIKPEVIINFAAQGEGATSFEHSDMYFDTNCTMLVRLVMELQSRTWLQRFIHIGTSELYGSVDRPVNEEAPIRATSPYAASKAGFDLYLMSMWQTKKFPMNILRPCNCYGPGQQLHRVIPRAILFGLTGRKLQLHGGGKAQKSYMHTTDLARAIHLIEMKAPLGEVYNAGPDHPTVIRDLVDWCAEAMGLDPDQLYELAPDRAHQDAVYWLDSSKIKQLGWKPVVSWKEGLDGMVAWGREHLDELVKQPIDFVMRE